MTHNPRMHQMAVYIPVDLYFDLLRIKKEHRISMSEIARVGFVRAVDHFDERRELMEEGLRAVEERANAKVQGAEFTAPGDRKR